MAKRDTYLPQQSVNKDLMGMDGELKQAVNVPIPDNLPTTYADKKQDRFRPRSLELHFTTSLYIDRAAALLQAQAQKVNDRQDLFVVQCDVISVDSDRTRIRLESLRRGKPTGRLEGTMQRWQGSLTRVDMAVQHFSHNLERRATLAVGAILGLGVIGASAVSVLCMQALDVPPEKSTMPLAVLTSVLALVAVVIYESIIHSRFRRIRITEAMALRDVDELTAILTSVFGEHDLHWVN